MSVLPIGGASVDLGELQRFAGRSLLGRRLRLVVDEEDPVELPAVVGEALAKIVSILNRGRPVLIAAQNVELTTGEAAELLGVTRPTVVKLMEDGVLPFTRPNSSRRIALHDVLAYKQRCSTARRQALDELTAEAVDLGVYDEAIRRSRRETAAPANDQAQQG
jgi:excisionase family DNA binding protein